MKKILLMTIFICTFFIVNISSYADVVKGVKIEQAKEFKKVKSGKKVFIETLIPIIAEVRNDILEQKKYTQSLLEKTTLSDEEKKFLNEMYDKYKVKSKKTDDLIVKMVVPPTSFILGQAALESGWGKSKLAEEGNNLFGMRSLTKSSKIAVKVGKGQYYKRYKSIQDSVEDYIFTLARHRSYSNLRRAITEGEDSIKLIDHLANYSEVKNIYAKRLAIVIEKNNFQKYDKQ